MISNIEYFLIKNRKITWDFIYRSLNLFIFFRTFYIENSINQIGFTMIDIDTDVVIPARIWNELLDRSRMLPWLTKCNRTKLEEKIVQSGIIKSYFDTNITEWNNNNPDSMIDPISDDVVECIEELMSNVILDNCRYVQKQIFQIMLNTGFTTCSQIASYWTNIFTGQVIGIAVSEGYTEIKCGHATATLLTMDDGWGWGKA
jgi:hypothetical protein